MSNTDEQMGALGKTGASNFESGLTVTVRRIPLPTSAATAASDERRSDETSPQLLWPKTGASG